jgi:hypothetical protein
MKDHDFSKAEGGKFHRRDAVLVYARKRAGSAWASSSTRF